MRVDLNVPMDGARSADVRGCGRCCRRCSNSATRARSCCCCRTSAGPRAPFAARYVDRAAGSAAGRASGRSVRFIEDCQGLEAARAISTMLPGDIGILENTRFHLGEERMIPGWPGDGGARQLLCQRCFLGVASRPCLDRGGGALPAVVRRPGDGGRAERAGECAWQSRAAGSGGGRRRQGVDQAGRARPPGRQGRSLDHRRRHGQHLPRGARRRCRQVPGREGPDRRGGQHLRTCGCSRLHHPPAVRRGGGEGIRANPPSLAHRATSTKSRPTR